ncbi:hypothetical protein Zmor_028503 [Zophobas morio]|uniref:Inosine triphosphate pyrophosphatase n=2 Tax=Zophobas morio TaxID=2755281 RepID=A0AA38HNH5_9CUCU|nr:hypothetical protein Zmor_028503 [Zophobas morio]
MRSVTFVTANTSKLEEVKAIASDFLEINSVSLDLPELQGEPEDIARAKCKFASNELGVPVITEDTSLCFNALSGLPGPYVKWFLSKIGLEGLNNLLAAYKDKTAYAVCIFAYSPSPSSEPVLFIGKTEGTIVPSQGPSNFGWDPIFQPAGFKNTYAELAKSEKNKISHRYKALEKLKSFFLQFSGTE